MKSLISMLMLALTLAPTPSLADEPKASNSGGIGDGAYTPPGPTGEPCGAGATWCINAVTGEAVLGNIMSSGGPTAVIDLTGTTAIGWYGSGGAPVYSFYPSVGNDTGDHQRAQQLIRFNPSLGATISETGLSIDARMNSGFATAYTNNTVYNSGDLIDVNASIYKVITNGTSASSGRGPTGTGTNITDGTMHVAWQCHDQCNAKMPLFVSATAGPRAGHVWAADVDLILQSGWNGQFGTAFESDITNDAGADCGGCQNFLATGDPGPKKVQAAFSAYDPSSTLNSWINGYQVVGRKAYSNAGFYDSAFGGAYGVLLAGGYTTAGIMMAYDNAQIRFGGGGTSLNRWRIISNIAGSADGALTFQHSADNFGSNFVSDLTLLPTGDIQLTAGVIMEHTTVATLPICNTALKGDLRYVTDASSPTYGGSLVGGGSTSALALCNGSSWTAH
jgi:hypothetical protein